MANSGLTHGTREFFMLKKKNLLTQSMTLQGSGKQPDNVVFLKEFYRLHLLNVFESAVVSHLEKACRPNRALQ